MQNFDLSELKDIHHPIHELSVFPLAIGWWILIFLPIGLFFCIYLYNFLKKQSSRFFAFRELNDILKSQDSLNKKIINISILMKRIAIKKYGNEKIANLYGNSWADFINQSINYSDKSIIEVIANSTYVKQSSDIDINIEKVKKIASDFIRQNT